MHLADARNKEDLRSAVRGCDAVVNVIGGGTLCKNDVESTTSAVAVAAATEVGVDRYLAISAGMVALDHDLLYPAMFSQNVARKINGRKMYLKSAQSKCCSKPED